MEPLTHESLWGNWATLLLTTDKEGIWIIACWKKKSIHLYPLLPAEYKGKYPNHACDRFMALVGKWANVGPVLRWPYCSIPESYVETVRKEVNNIIPEFYNQQKSIL